MSPLRAFIIATCFKTMPTVHLRAWYLRRLGARVGENARIHSIDFMNTDTGFDHLTIGSNCYLGPGVLIDLAGEVRVMDGAVISARTILLSHDDPGASHNSPLSKHFPPSKRTTVIGRNCWLGAGSIVLAGTEIGEQCVLAAGSVAKGTLLPFSLYAGHPAKHKRQIPSSIP